MASDIIDLWNQSLRDIGYRRRVAEPYEGTEASKACLEVYGQVRDELLRAEDWDFARRSLPLALLKGPPPAGGYYPGNVWGPTYPPPGWLYEYGYPADCIELGAILPPPGRFPIYDPKPAVWRVDNDNTYSPAVKVILTNVAGAVAIYRAQVIDPSTWNAGFAATLVSRLAAKLAVALAGSPDLMKAAQQESAADGAVANMRRG
jgi:hypothetical protein